jgi:hypothetical protein
MKTILSLLALTLFGLSPVLAQDAEEETEAAAEQPAAEPVPEDADGAKMLTGMSILGNEETPKSLVIVPWKSSEMGDELSLSDTLDDRARPVDKEVFLRELRFYELRASE